MSAAEDELRELKYNIHEIMLKVKILSARPDDATKVVMQLIEAHDKALLDRVRTEVIGEDIPLSYKGKPLKVGDIVDIDWLRDEPKMIATFVQDNGKNNQKAEMRAKLNALLPSGGVEGEHHDDSN